MPPKLTAVAPRKFVPVKVTIVVEPALLGLNEVITGAGGIWVNPAKIPVPPGVVTLTVPEVPAATTAVMLVAETKLKEVAAIPPKLTAETPVKFVPVKVTVAPVAAEVGVNEVITGAGINVKPVRVPVPPGLVTLILPEVPAETTAVMLVAETTVKEVAAVPPKLTAVTPIKFVPVRVTVAPVAAEVGVNEVIVGAGILTVIPFTRSAMFKFASAPAFQSSAAARLYVVPPVELVPVLLRMTLTADWSLALKVILKLVLEAISTLAEVRSWVNPP